MIANVTGQFNKFTGTVETDGEDITTAKVHFTADIDSISTNNDQRDAHLKGADFFEAEKHPKLIFEGDKLRKIREDKYELEGTLTMRGISKREKFEVEYGGLIQDPWGNSRVGFTLEGKIQRKDFGVNFGLSDTGKVMLSNEVRIIANAQFVRQASK